VVIQPYVGTFQIWAEQGFSLQRRLKMLKKNSPRATVVELLLTVLTKICWRP
jgi:hypothetical protein